MKTLSWSPRQWGSPTHLWNSLWRSERFQEWWFAPVVWLCGQLLSALVWWCAAWLLRCRKWRIKWHHCYSRLLFCLFWACTNSTIKWLNTLVTFDMMSSFKIYIPVSWIHYFKTKIMKMKSYENYESIRQDSNIYFNILFYFCCGRCREAIFGNSLSVRQLFLSLSTRLFGVVFRSFKARMSLFQHNVGCRNLP